MSLQEIVILRVKNGLKSRLEEIALEHGVSKSALARNILALAILPHEEPSKMELILKKIKEETEKELYVRSRESNNGNTTE